MAYGIPQRLRRISKDSTVFVRLRCEVVFALASKYALTLYEMVQNRGNLRWRSSEKFSLEDMPGVLGVPKGKLTSWSNLKQRAIDPAVEVVSAPSDYVVEVAPIKTGRRVTHVKLRGWRKHAGGEAEVERELQFSKVWCAARVAEKARPWPDWLEAKGAALRAERYETAKLRFPGYDILRQRRVAGLGSG